jgi:hypothetical protein
VEEPKIRGYILHGSADVAKDMNSRKAKVARSFETEI